MNQHRSIMNPTAQNPYSLPAHIDDCRLIVRNLPADFRPTESGQLLSLFGASAVHPIAGHRSASVCAEFPNPGAAHAALRFLHQKSIDGFVLRVEFARRNSPDSRATAPPTVADVPSQISKLDTFVAQLNATATHLAQPPPPHLRYSYPKASRDILDSICIALETTPRFYTQVLHLMNRMNLEPPFIPGDRKLRFARGHRDVATQTDHSQRLIGTDESELESSGDEAHRRRTIGSQKRGHDGDLELQQKRIRMIRKQNSQASARTTSIALNEIFEAVPVLVSTPRIRIVVPASTSLESKHIQTKSANPSDEEQPMQPSSYPNTDRFSIDTLHHERIPCDQLPDHPLFQNYDPGKLSAKLYVKNLAKTVTDDRVRQLFALFTPRDDAQAALGTIEVRVMRTGRMKGQAFVTYGPGPYLSDDRVLAASQRARRETNGLLLDGRPMVVVFGKQPPNQINEIGK